jgi:spermidine/putrescine ABC transporter ATP-binding subunit
MSEPIKLEAAEVRLEQVSKLYGATAVVDNIDLTARGGEILALLGPSGCGKTTTLRMIAGLITPSSGRISINGADVTSVPAHQRNLGMLFQNYALFPHLTVQENVAFGLGMRKVPAEEKMARSMEALRLVRLDAYAERMPAALSGGQQQRVALARAIVYRPRLLLLDEPFGALDKKLREAMQIELRLLCTQLGLTTILVTHDQEEALILADRIAVMRGGRIEQIAASREVYERPCNTFVADFIGTSNFIKASVTTRSGDATELVAAGGLRMRSSLPNEFASGAEVMVAIRPESIRLSPASTADEAAGNSVSGPVVQTVFKGQNLAVWIKLPDESDFVCTLPIEDAALANPQRGELWRASWPAERTMIVREQ